MAFEVCFNRTMCDKCVAVGRDTNYTFCVSEQCRLWCRVFLPGVMLRMSAETLN